MNIRVNADIDELDNVLQFVENTLEKLNVSEDITFQVKVCVEEVFVNIASYAYPDKKDEYADIDISLENETIVIEFVDEGIYYNPLEKEDPDIELSAEEREVGGLGIFMVKTLMDDVSYNRREGKNCLQIRKNIVSELI